MPKGVLNTKSYSFALEIIRVYKYLFSEKKEFVLSKQVLRSGTAIGALVREAEHAQSKKDFLNKMNISLKEANETEYWIDLLKDSDFISLEEYANISQKIKEILRLLISTVKTTKQHLGIN